MRQLHRGIRLASILIFVASLGLLAHRLHRTPDQEELRRYVEVELPLLRTSEDAIFERLTRLRAVPGLQASEARTLLVDDVVPRLLHLRKEAEAPLSTARFAARPLVKEYIEVVDRFIDACRTSIRVIDSEDLSTKKSLERSRDQFTAAQRAHQAWQERVRKTCALHRLAALPKSSEASGSGSDGFRIESDTEVVGAEKKR
jgi:hypothetical protein